MTKKKSKSTSKKKPSLLQRIGTFISFLVVAIAALIGVITGNLVNVDENTNTNTSNVPTGNVSMINVQQGYGAQRDFWQVYFTAPTGSTDRSTYVGGVDVPLMNAINSVQSTLDIAAFEWNNPALTEAVINAHNRGVTVRMVVDNEHTMEDEDSTIEDVIDMGIPVIDDDRSALMHNKFMIMDGTTVWTGSMNYTINGTYRNNNNMLMMRSQRVVETYQTEFNEMFVYKQFGSSRSPQNNASFNQDGVPIKIMFAPEDNVVPNLLDEISKAQSDIRFMTFSFTLDSVGQALLQEAENGVNVQGIFEVRGSQTQFSEMPRLACAGLDVRQDGNSFTFHHKVFIIDDNTVLTGSFNISDNATNSNDENMVIINDPDIAAQYIAEYNRMYAQATVPDRSDFTCP